jgi:hypothetical protein
LALSAALVVLPATSLGVVACGREVVKVKDYCVKFTLMSPTATVCLMSLTANRPRGGKSMKGSTHIGLEGISLTMAASPDLMNFGASLVDLPVDLLEDLGELAGDVRGVAVQHRRVAWGEGLVDAGAREIKY